MKTQDSAKALFNMLSEKAELINWMACDPEAHEPAAAIYLPLFREINTAGQRILNVLDTWARYEGDESGRPHRALRKALVLAYAFHGEKKEDDSGQYPEAVTSFKNTLDKGVLSSLAKRFAFIYEVGKLIPETRSAERIRIEAESAMEMLHLYSDIIASTDTDDKPDWYKTAQHEAAIVYEDYTKLVQAFRELGNNAEPVSGIPAVDAEDKLRDSLSDLQMYGRLLAEIDPEHGDMDADTLAHLGNKIETSARSALECVGIMNQA